MPLLLKVNSLDLLLTGYVEPELNLLRERTLFDVTSRTKTSDINSSLDKDDTNVANASRSSVTDDDDLDDDDSGSEADENNGYEDIPSEDESEIKSWFFNLY